MTWKAKKRNVDLDELSITAVFSPLDSLSNITRLLSTVSNTKNIVNISMLFFHALLPAFPFTAQPSHLGPVRTPRCYRSVVTNNTKKRGLFVDIACCYEDNNVVCARAR